MSTIEQIGLEYLRQALNRPDAQFRDGQWESIVQLLNKKRALVVQRTGWGKSMVYFLATRLLRDQGAGPTLLVSPLLSLMRNQIEAARRIGVEAATINSSNVDEWESIGRAIQDNQIDVLLISPERLGNAGFLRDVMGGILNKIGLLVIDEAHCISDWGHDFRPDYRRIVRIVQLMPPNVPILATTATANNRVVNDVQSQLGNDIEVVRGTLVRKSLKLQNITLPDPAQRLAWLAKTIPTLPSSGIVYTLTQRDALMVADWLRENGISAQAYHSDIGFSDDSMEEMARWAKMPTSQLYNLPEAQKSTMYKEFLEQQLLENRIKVLVATVALGMGFDKPDLGFVIHYQRPSSVVHYYQQVGRAGRAVDLAYGILLCGQEDDRIADYFIQSAFPPQKHIGAILTALGNNPEGLSTVQLQRQANLRPGQIEKTLKYLSVEEPCPVLKNGTKWFTTPMAYNYQIDTARVEGITNLRRQEQQQMRDYMSCKTCLMRFLQQALDDPGVEDCGQCVNCAPEQLLPTDVDSDLLQKASHFLRGTYQVIEPRKRWPEAGILQTYPFSRKSVIPEELLVSEGRSLSLWLDGGWGQLVSDGLYRTHRFDDQLVQACVEMVRTWNFGGEAPKWVICVPSKRSGALVPDFAARLASALNLPFKPRIRKILDNPAQEVMENGYMKCQNQDGAYAIDIQPPAPGKSYAPCILVDDIVSSRWTFTVVGALLRQLGCRAVYPLALTMKLE